MLIHNSKRLGEYIRSCRKAQKLSQSNIGESVGLKQATISDFENKPEHAQIETLFKILSASDLEIHLIQKGTDFFDEKHKWDEPW